MQPRVPPFGVADIEARTGIVDGLSSLLHRGAGAVSELSRKELSIAAVPSAYSLTSLHTRLHTRLQVALSLSLSLSQLRWLYVGLTSGSPVILTISLSDGSTDVLNAGSMSSWLFCELSSWLYHQLYGWLCRLLDRRLCHQLDDWFSLWLNRRLNQWLYHQMDCRLD